MRTILTLPAASGFSAPAGATYLELSLANFSTWGRAGERENLNKEILYQFLFPLCRAATMLLLLAARRISWLHVVHRLSFNSLSLDTGLIFQDYPHLFVKST